MPKWFYFHLDKMSAWSRTMLLPLAIVTVLRPTRKLSPTQGIDELFVSQSARHRLKMRPDVPAFWRGFFGTVDWLLKRVHDVFGTRWRRRAIERAFQWSATRMGQEMPAPTRGLGAIFPPMVYIQVVMHALGIPRSDATVQRSERELDEFMIEEGNRIRLQPCFSPVWDTGIALYALADCGLDVTNPMAPPTSRRPSEACGGSSPCRMTTAAGRPSTRPSTARCMSTCLSPTTTRSRTRAAPTSRAACWSA
jgi:squalene-hopene/tetraprenyl-beta-curcumene cyclase